MAHHQTRKNRDEEKEATKQIRSRRAAKYHVPPLDLKRLERELRRERRT